MSLPQERSTAGLVSYTWVARSRSGSSSFTALALNKPSSSLNKPSSSSATLCQRPPVSAVQRAESGGMVLVAYAGPVRPAAALRDSVLCSLTDIHSLFINKPSSS